MNAPASHLIIDVTRISLRLAQGRLPTGVDRVCLEYITHYRYRAQALIRLGNWHIVLPQRASEEIFSLLLAPSYGLRYALIKHLAQNASQLLHPIPLVGKLLVNTGHSGLERTEYAENLQQLGAKLVYFIHDIIPITHPEYTRGGESEKHVRRMNTALRTASGIITNSVDTTEKLAQYAARTEYAMPQAISAPLAAAKLPAPNPARPIAKPYFVMLGTIEPRKNHAFILQLWRCLVENNAAHAPHLVIIGQVGWECEQVVDLLERSEAIASHVTVLERCTDAEVSTYLHHAQALLFPSFAEGYGMPLVEALASGTPVIASDLTVFKEIFSDIPEYLHPLDGPGWLHAITHYAQEDSALRTAQLERIAQYQPPTWDDHFQMVDQFLDSLLGR